MRIGVKNMEREKILLVLLPFWSTLMPPLGIAALKSYLQQYNYDVTVIDANTEDQFKELQEKYFNTLKGYIPPGRQGNFYNVGNDVLRNHMMAHLHYDDETGYNRLIKIIIYQTYFTDISEPHVKELDEILCEFYSRLEHYLIALIQEEGPTVLGLSVFEDTLPASLFSFKITKEKYPHIRTVIGGGVFTSRMAVGSPNWQLFLEKTPYIDKILVGEGEILFRKYLAGELPPSQKVATLEEINGETLDLSTVGVPDFSGLNMEYYLYQGTYTSRGCPFQCSFCSETVFWRNYRKKDAKQIVREMMHLYRQYDSQLFLMGDSLLNPIVNDLAGELLDTDTAIYWDGYIRADRHVCDLENTRMWRRAGFYRARLGIESGSQHVLDLMDKKIRVQQVKDALASLAHAGIKTTTYWVIGHPGETEEDFRMTLDFIEELKDCIYEVDCNPFEYYLAGQAHSPRWVGEHKHLSVYPGSAKDMLIIQTYTLDCQPSREETYKRVSRFIQHCKQLGIPNPYSLYDIFKADERWKAIHKNAVPAAAEFKGSRTYIDECKHVQDILFAKKSDMEDTTFSF
jgi:radical SAM superfamily enzyme YgiQ (UPF0313 family)